MDLRPYQIAGVAQIMKKLEAGARGVAYRGPTGCGKTTVKSAVVGEAVRNHKPVALLAHRIELVEQISERLQAFGIDHDCVTADSDCGSRPVKVCMIPTLVRRSPRLAKWLSTVELVSIDEAHHIAADGWQKAAGLTPKAQYVGYSATPWRLDGRGLGTGGFFTEQVDGPSIRALIRSGYLVEAEVFAPPVEIDISKIKRVGGDFSIKDQVETIDMVKMTELAHLIYAKYAPGETGAIFVPSVAVAQFVAERFRKHGWRAVALFGDMPQAERQAAMAAIRAQKVDIIVNVDLLTEGVDIPALAFGIEMRMTASTALSDQMRGRFMRVCDGKPRARIFDLVGNTGRHGLPGQHRDWSLADGIAGRPVRTEPVSYCPSCYRVHRPAPTCPSCGRDNFTFGELAKKCATSGPKTDILEVINLPGVAGKTAVQIHAMPFKQAVALCRTEEDYRRLAKIKGYDSKWAARQASFRSGGWRAAR